MYLTSLDRVGATNEQSRVVGVIVGREGGSGSVHEVALILLGHLNVKVIGPRV